MKRTFRTAAVALALCLPATMLLAGCGTQSGSTLVKLERDTPLNEDRPLTAEARQDGVVALYATNDVTPKVTYNVRKGEKVGFRRTGTNVEAFAGDNVFPVSSDPVFERTFYWKFQDQK